MTTLRLALAVLLVTNFSWSRSDLDTLYSVKVKAQSSTERNQLVELGIAIDAVYSDSVGFLATQKELDLLKKNNISYFSFELPTRLDGTRGFPAGDEAFHDYAETIAAIDALAQQYPGLVEKIAIGKSLEGRELYGVRISANPAKDSLPTAVFVGCHHAREHLSVEIPLKLAQHLVNNYSRDARIAQLLNTREVWIVPMINPDGAEHDIATGSYRYWRKNRRSNGDNTFGIDLNRNYGKGWGGPGSSSSTSSDIYRGPSAFSEPETLAVRDFLRNRKKATVMVSFHTFSELILWPWGHSNDAISNESDRLVFETMGKKMATWNHYTPEKSSDLYLASGDTTDWAYDELKVFAYTFELSPNSMLLGGFYPGAEAIEPTFKANIEPALYLIEKAENPYTSIAVTQDPLGVL